MIARGVAPAAAAILAAALVAPAAWSCAPAGQGFARLASVDAEIAYRWLPSQLKVGQFFAAEVIACRAPGPGAVSDIVLDAQMPAHGHGMNYRPTGVQQGPARFHITGLRRHMPGTWRLTFDLMQGDRRTRLAQDVTLRP
jgi:hypothetical protein